MLVRVPNSDEWRDGSQFIRVSIFDDDPDRIEYEVWRGNDDTGYWEPLSFHKTYETAIRAAKSYATRG